jgi:hypothetical protein
MVRYKVKPERAGENEELVRAVYAELAQSRPPGLRYETYKLDDGVSFVHVAVTAERPGPLPQVAAFRRFQQAIAERCAEPPVATELSPVGSYDAAASPE